MSDENPFIAEWTYKPGPSRLLLGFIVITHVVAFATVLFINGLLWWWKALIVIIILLSALYNGRLYTGKIPGRWVSCVCWRGTGGWELETADARKFAVIFSENSFYSHFLSVLNFKTRLRDTNRRFTVILLPDNSDSEIRRHLIRRLKLLSSSYE